MKYIKSTFLVCLALGAIACQGKDQGEDPAVQSYQQALTEFQKNKPFKIPEAAKALMEKAAKELAAKLPNPGIQVGQKAPDFTLPNAFGKKISLSDQLKKGPVILSFYRGSWCPYCNLELQMLQQSIPAFDQYGARLIAITPQNPDASKKQLEEDELLFEVLSDLDNSIIKSYRLYFEIPEYLQTIYQQFGIDLAQTNASGTWSLPVPATFVIDQNRVVRAAFADSDYTKRMEAADIIAALKKLDKK